MTSLPQFLPRGGEGPGRSCSGAARADSVDGGGVRMGKASALGLPDGTRALLFDCDGVLTQTAKIHAAAWKEMFDDYLRQRAQRPGEPLVPFTADDYARYVDGKLRADGARAFLESRGI